MGADDDARGSVGDPGKGAPSACGGEAAGQQHHARPSRCAEEVELTGPGCLPLPGATEGRQQGGDGEEVLAGQDLGRGHDRCLVAALGGHEGRVERHDRLAGPHVALEQPVHRRCLRQVPSDAAALLAFYQRHFRRQGSFPVLEREL